MDVAFFRTDYLFFFHKEFMEPEQSKKEQKQESQTRTGGQGLNLTENTFILKTRSATSCLRHL